MSSKNPLFERGLFDCSIYVVSRVLSWRSSILAGCYHPRSCGEQCDFSETRIIPHCHSHLASSQGLPPIGLASDRSRIVGYIYSFPTLFRDFSPFALLERYLAFLARQHTLWRKASIVSVALSLARHRWRAGRPLAAAVFQDARTFLYAKRIAIAACKRTCSSYGFLQKCQRTYSA